MPPLALRNQLYQLPLNLGNLSDTRSSTSSFPHFLPHVFHPVILPFVGGYSGVAGSCRKRQKPQAPTPQAPIRNRQTRKVANAKGLNRNTNLT